MKGFPKHIATKQDFLNLLAMPEFKEQALQDLLEVYRLDDDTMTVVVSGPEETGYLVTEERPAPNPVWKQKGFASREEIADLIIASGGEV